MLQAPLPEVCTQQTTAGKTFQFDTRTKLDTFQLNRKMATIYDYTLRNKQGQDVSLADYTGKVLLVVNSATGCGFTPHYEALEKFYETYNAQGFEIIDVPCNQFADQTPGTDEEITEFCTANYGVKYTQFAKADVKEATAIPLFQWLTAQKPFEGLHAEHPIHNRLVAALDQLTPGWKDNNEVKWNFTKFLINRQGNVIARFEPTHDLDAIEAAIKAAL